MNFAHQLNLYNKLVEYINDNIPNLYPYPGINGPFLKRRANYNTIIKIYKEKHIESCENQLNEAIETPLLIKRKRRRRREEEKEEEEIKRRRRIYEEEEEKSTIKSDLFKELEYYKGEVKEYIKSMIYRLQDFYKLYKGKIESDWEAIKTEILMQIKIDTITPAQGSYEHQEMVETNLKIKLEEYKILFTFDEFKRFINSELLLSPLRFYINEMEVENCPKDWNRFEDYFSKTIKEAALSIAKKHFPEKYVRFVFEMVYNEGINNDEIKKMVHKSCYWLNKRILIEEF